MLKLPKIKFDFHYVYSFVSSNKLETIHKNEFFDCREEFHMDMDNNGQNKFIGMVVKNKIHASQIVLSIKKAENKLKIRNSIFYFYNKNKIKILIIKPNRFWKRNQLRIQLLTVIMKGAKKYLQTGSNDYAYKKFLNGYTYYNEDYFDGWGDVFGYTYLSTKEYRSLVDKLLKKRKA